MVHAAAKRGGAIGAFNVILIEHAEAYAIGANASKLPTIFQISQNAVEYHGFLKPIARACQAIAEQSEVDISVHLDHAEDENLIRQALDLGFDSIMFDGSKLDFATNVAKSAELAKLCKQYGASLEVELGEVGACHRRQVDPMFPQKKRGDTHRVQIIEGGCAVTFEMQSGGFVEIGQREL